jgi:hypothetical protein
MFLYESACVHLLVCLYVCMTIRVCAYHRSYVLCCLVLASISTINSILIQFN